MAGLAATRLFAAAGAGGVALTAWALRRSGMEPRLVACRMVAFIVLLYVVYAGSLVIDGIGLGIGLFPGGGTFALTFLPAILALIAFATAGAIALLPGRYRAPPGPRGTGARPDPPAARPPGDRSGADRQRRAHGDRAGSPQGRRRAGGSGLVGF